MQRTIFIGDVHGCYDELISLYEKAWIQDEDHLYFCGDLVNKWPKSLEVIEWVRARPNTWTVTGNHEYFPFIHESHLHKYGGSHEYMSEGSQKWVYDQHERSQSLREVFEERWHIEWLHSLPIVIEKDNFILVHAGLHPDFGVDTPIEIATLLRIYKGKPWYEYYTWEKLVIYWHWAVNGLRITKNTIGLDTWCCFGGHLTAYCLETKEFWQVRANQVYKEPAHWKLLEHI